MKRPIFLLMAAFTLIFTLAGVAIGAPAAIFTARSTGQRDYIDPVVSPGVRSAHEHCFYGATGVTVMETSQSLREKPSTWVEPGNHTGIWIPCVYEDGRLLLPATTKHLLAYYQPVSGTEQVPPENTEGVTQEVGWRCGIGGGAIHDLPPTTCDGVLVVSGFFRGARDFDLTQPFPDIRFFIRLNVGSGAVGRITVGGPTLGVDGALGPDTIHGDYLFGWDRDTFQVFLTRCVIPSASCGTNPNL